jgi:hypothetical protein
MPTNTYNLNEALPELQIDGQSKPSVTAHVDDIIILVTRPHDFVIIRTAMECNTLATKAIPNIIKSKALAIGGWTQPRTELRIATYDQIKILGITFSRTRAQSSTTSWEQVINAVRAQARLHYARSLLSRTAHTICSDIPALKDTVYSTMSPADQNPIANHTNHMLIFHLPRVYPKSPSYHTTTLQVSR